MAQAVTPISPARGTRMLHAALVIGLTLVGATFFGVLLSFQGQPLGSNPSLGDVLAGLAVVLLVVASFTLRRRVPQRRFDQSSEDYWAGPESRGASIRLWTVVDGAGLMAWVGYVMTGRAAPVVAAVLAIVTLIAFRPSRLEGDGTV